MDLEALQKRLQEALGPEFTVGPLLGQGGFAAVFRTRDNTLNRDVAVKVLDLELSPSPTVAERFLREAQTVARLEHPHIVPIYKVGRQAEVFYIIMRCIDGTSLRVLLERNKKLSIGDAARIARQVADALGYAHKHDIVHRDIKPDNVLLDTSGHVLVTDFGIAKAAQAAQAATPGGATAQLTTEGMIIGTPQYMSPEQASGDRLDGRSDIYSLGIVVYQMLAGTPPFDGPSSASILAQQLTQPPAPIRRERPDVPEEMAFVLERMLEKSPAKRFQTASEVSRALVDALPTAARNRVQVPFRRRLTAMFYKSLLGLSVGGCLLSLAFMAGAGVVAYTLFSKPPRIEARAPLPDSLTRVLRARRVLASEDAAMFAYQPGNDTTLLVVTRRRTAVVLPRAVRSYARDSAQLDMDFDVVGGLGARLVLRRINGTKSVDTVFRSLSFRDVVRLSLVLQELEQDSPRRANARVRIRPRSD
jgi:serine/threonine-protein kinase